MDNVNAQSLGKHPNMFWVIGAFLLSKGVGILKALKALKYAKFAITAITMSISALLYGFAFGSWYFATGLVLLLVHEYGHVIALWKKGIHASAPVFIPFLGAAVFAKIPETKDDEAYIGYGGPLIGTLGALACIGVALMFPEGSFWSVLLHILGNVGLFINLFNLIPARPLDGGRILHPLGTGVVYCGFTLLLILAYMTQDLFFVLIALFSVENMPVRKWVRCMLWSFLCTASAFAVVFSPDLTNFFKWLCISVLTCLTLAPLYMAWKSRGEPMPDMPSETETISRFVKIKWLVLYLLLLAVISGSMVWHSQHLPKEVRESSLVRFVHQY